MTATLGPLVVEAADPAAVEAFWAAVLGPQEQRRLLRAVPQRGPKSGKNRVHLDLALGPGEPAIERLLTLGAPLLAEHLPGWVTMADVEGNRVLRVPRRTGRPHRTCSGFRGVHRQRPAGAAGAGH